MLRYLWPCETEGGKALLREWLRSPLVDLNAIKKRQSIVESLIDTSCFQKAICDGLKKLPDITMPLLRIYRRFAIGKDIPKVWKFCEMLHTLKEKILPLPSFNSPGLNYLHAIVRTIPDIHRPEYK